MEIKKGKYKFAGSPGTFELTKVTNDEVTILARYVTNGKTNKLTYDRNQFEQMLQNGTWEKV